MPVNKKTKLHKTLNIALRLLIIAVAYAFIYFRIFHKSDIRNLWNTFSEHFQDEVFYKSLSFLFLLMLVNWGIEALKWKFLVKKIEKVSFLKSYKAVFTGITVSSFFPNRIGEYFGRVFVFETANRWEGILCTIVGSMSQLLVTLLAGLIGLTVFVFSFLHPEMYLFGYAGYGFIFMMILSFICLLFLYFHVSLLANIRLRYRRAWIKKAMKHLHVFASFSTKELSKILLYSAIRYFIFSMQFYLLLQMFAIPVSFCSALLLISVIYLIMASIPTIALTELGVRGSVALFIFDFYFTQVGTAATASDPGIFAASTLLWLINIALPALVGTFFVYQLKFIRK
ncbi:MAG: lysylphosphatidylglycerol synthase domain-containing protein [Lentimicrobiaceae bacterium]|nr:lysylphosphatidylglycerol synthase domain-containing protein [Lentimicrobiaceae bacterium]